MEPANTEIFRIKVIWQVTWQVLILTSTFTFPSKTLLHHINDATGLNKKTLLPPKNVYDLEDIFPLTDMYAIQVI